MDRGLFITVEGTDGSGKSTQIALMREYLAEKGREAVLTREPGGTIISEKIRELTLDPGNGEMCSATEALLYAASRAQLVSQVIRPALESGKVVICDRFLDSSYVYQGFGRGMGMETVECINKPALDGVLPDITFFFGMKPEEALRRRMETTAADRMEKEDIDFHKRVYTGYKELCSMFPERIKTIDASRSIGEISRDVRKWLDKLLGTDT